MGSMTMTMAAGRRSEPGDAALQARLAEALAEPDTIVVLVFGDGPEADQAEARCRWLALDPDFDALRVVRVPDRMALTRAQRARWSAGDRRLAVVASDRERAVPLDRPDAVDLFVAVAMAAA
jgi:hypothetical protein